ncbi:MAG: hypothetical protein CL820_05250 [Croceicoccus sp.]|nr:hypothetical protein [Croceicoccus sp.]MAL25296.1 hypothetical protein [Croceicoccus sp.]
MAKSNRVYTKKQRPEAAGTMVGVRLQPDDLELLDLWIAAQDEHMTRPEAMRRVLRMVALRTRSLNP